MAQPGDELERGGIEAQGARTPEVPDKQAWLIKLAERTVLQAETLAQEITERAKQECEVEGAKLRKQYTVEAKEEACRIIESAEQQCATLTDEAMSTAQADIEKVLGKAQTQARETLADAEAERQSIVARAQREVLAITDAAKARADSVESNGRLRTESIIRRMCQNVISQLSQNLTDAIQCAVVESGKHVPPALDELKGQVREEPFADQNDSDAAVGEELPDKEVSKVTHGDPRVMGEPTPVNEFFLVDQIPLPKLTNL